MPFVTTGRLGQQPTMENIQSQIDEITEVINGGIQFGDPQNPRELVNAVPSGFPLAGFREFPAVDHHNGTVLNIDGSWVEIPFTAAGGILDLICTHDLYLDTPGYTLPVAGEPNCRWIDFGRMQDGFNSDATTIYFSDVYFIGGPVTANSIELRFSLFRTGPGTINEFHPFRFNLFFTKATRGE